MTFSERFFCAPEALIFDPERRTLTLEGSVSGPFDMPADLSVGATVQSADSVWQVPFDGHTSLRAGDGSGLTLFRVLRNEKTVAFLCPVAMARGTPFEVVSGWNPVTDHALAEDMTGAVAHLGPGTMVETEDGEIPVEWLETSDRVLTRDNGFQPILWIGRRRVDPGIMRRNAGCGLLCIPAGTLGPDLPTHDLRVTGGLRFRLEPDGVLAPSQALADNGLAATLRPPRRTTLTTILCASHELILAEGTWVETMHASPATIPLLPTEIQQALGPDGHGSRTVLPWVRRHEAAKRLSEMLPSQTMLDQTA